jgi:hypothetical protein
VVRMLRIPVPKAKDPTTNFSLSFNLTVKSASLLLFVFAESFLLILKVSHRIWLANGEDTRQPSLLVFARRMKMLDASIPRSHERTFKLCLYSGNLFSLMLLCFHEFDEHVQLTTTQCFIL